MARERAWACMLAHGHKDACICAHVCTCAWTRLPACTHACIPAQICMQAWPTVAVFCRSHTCTTANHWPKPRKVSAHFRCAVSSGGRGAVLRMRDSRVGACVWTSVGAGAARLSHAVRLSPIHLSSAGPHLHTLTTPSSVT
eukprot:362868-Chlamydomonas_euryale.AAC.4